jgi:hypothetical protein
MNSAVSAVFVFVPKPSITASEKYLRNFTSPDNCAQSVDNSHLTKLAIHQWDYEKSDGAPDVTSEATLLGQRSLEIFDKICWTVPKNNVVVGQNVG